MFDPVSRTVTVLLEVGCGMTYYKLDKPEGNFLYHPASDKHTSKAQFELPMSIGLEEFKMELDERIQQKWDIDIQASRVESGGQGAFGVMNCSVDVEGSGQKNKITKINVPNEESWDAAKHLMRSARGEITVTFLFAVRRARWWERQTISWLYSHGLLASRP